MVTRRQTLQGLAASVFIGCPALPRLSRASGETGFTAAIAALEQRHGGRLGVAALNTASGRRISHRGDARFLLCSTVKFPAAALILSRVDAGSESLDRRVDYSAADLVTYSPETRQHVASGMTLAAICRAGLTQSDNTAANLMLESFGGPAALTAFARSLGDEVTRSDRYETALNDYTADAAQDTTTPCAMLHLMQRILVDNVLSEASRTQLITWMRANQTGDHRLRDGLPEAWYIGDKTGSGGDNTANDIAIAWPVADRPVLITAYYAGSNATHAQRDAVLAGVGEAVSRWVLQSAAA